jgi:hypothetical protein
MRRIVLAAVVLICLLNLWTTPLEAQSAITSAAITATHCEDYIFVQYTLATNLLEPATITALVGGINVGQNTGSGGIGTHNVTVSLTVAQPLGTLISAEINADTAVYVTEPVPCTVYNQTTPPNPLEGVQPSGLWEGYSDGRLNPDPAEYYSVWCQEEYINVFRSVPTTELVDRISLRNALGLDVGDTLGLGGGMTLVRNSEDTLTIYGSNGNLAPAYGEKAFSRSACIAQAPGPDNTLLWFVHRGDEDRYCAIIDSAYVCYASMQAWCEATLNLPYECSESIPEGERYLRMAFQCLNPLTGWMFGLVLLPGIWRRRIKR